MDAWRDGCPQGERWGIDMPSFVPERTHEKQNSPWVKMWQAPPGWVTLRVYDDYKNIQLAFQTFLYTVFHY